jgi:hypothetical protein
MKCPKCKSNMLHIDREATHRYCPECVNEEKGLGKKLSPKVSLKHSIGVQSDKKKEKAVKYRKYYYSYVDDGVLNPGGQSLEYQKCWKLLLVFEKPKSKTIMEDFLKRNFTTRRNPRIIDSWGYTEVAHVEEKEIKYGPTPRKFDYNRDA